MSTSLQYFGFDYQVVRSRKRKHACIKVQDCQVFVVVPESIRDERIQQLLKQKYRWIKEKLKVQESFPPVKPKEYVSGETFTYLGRNYRLKVFKGKPEPVKLNKGRFVVQVGVDNSEERRTQRIQDKLTFWYKEHALQRLLEKTERYAAIVGVQPKSVGIKLFKSRWGSCSLSGNVQYNWRIIIAPHRIVDYVVIHELCHMIHHNHSDKFWRLVESVLPECQQDKEWLKLNGRLLMI